MKAPPPFSLVIYGKRQMLPRPIAEPAAARMAASLPPKPPRFSVELISKSLFDYLSNKCYTHTLDLATQRRRNLCHSALDALDNRELGTYGIDDVGCRSLDSALRALHSALDNLVYGEVVHRLGDIVLAVKLAQRRTYCQVDTIAITYLLLQVVAAVIGTQRDVVKSYGVALFHNQRTIVQ